MKFSKLFGLMFTFAILVSVFFVPKAFASSMNSSIKLGNQYPWNKEFTVLVTTKSPEDLQKLVIEWDSIPAVEMKQPKFIVRNLKANQEYTFKFTIKPKVPGTHTLHANIVGYTATSTIADAVDLQIHLDKGLNLPKSGTYYMYLAIYIIVIIVVIAILGFILYKGGKFLVYDFIPKWIHKQKEKPL